MTAAALLELRDFRVAYAEQDVLRGVDLRVNTPGATILLGPSGTGKSTLLRTLSGFNAAQPAVRCSGEARYAGRELTSHHRPAMVRQNARLLVSTVIDNLVRHWAQACAMTSAEKQVYLRRWLTVRHCGFLGDTLDMPVVQLPLAQQRLVSVLACLLDDPPLLMLDEPTTGLSDEQAQPLLALLKAQSRERALLVAMHHVGRARWLADDAALLTGGRIQFAADARRFFAADHALVSLFVNTGSCPDVADYAVLGEMPDGIDAEGSTAGAEMPVSLPSVRHAVAENHERPHPSRTFLPQSMGPRGFVWLLKGRLAGTPRPGIVHAPEYDLGLLRAVGVVRLLSLTEMPFDEALARPLGIGCCSLPIPDMQAPSLEEAWRLCLQIDGWLAADEVVAVHCHAGLGRTGTVLAAYWLWRAGGQCTAVQALEHVRSLEPGWVQSASQIEFLQQFYMYLSRDQNSVTDEHRCSRPMLDGQRLQ